MSLYKEALEGILKNKEYKSKGIYTGIPYPFGRLNEYLTSIDRGQAIGILGGTGVGKSKFCRFTFLYNVYKFYKETGYKCRILYFCMEDSKVRTMKLVICHYLKEVHDITITFKELDSKGRELPDFVKDLLLEADEYFSEFEKIVTFIEGESVPSKLYAICKDVAVKLGGEPQPYYVEIEGRKVKQWKYQCDTHVIAVFDNMSNIDMDDEDNDEQRAILKFVKEFMRNKLCNFFNWTCVMVMQLDFESERPSFSKSGESNINKLEPTLASIGDSKRASRSLHLIFSLFSPSRFDLIHYPQPPKANPLNTYNIDVLGNRFRSLRIIKSNDTETGMRVGLLFDGISENFEELPLPQTPEIDIIYKSLTEKKGQKFVKLENKSIFVKVEQDEELPF